MNPIDRSEQDLVLLNDWMPQAQAGYTTRRFPLFLRKTSDLLDPENQRKFTALVSFRKFALLDQVHGGAIAVLEDPKKYVLDGFYSFSATDAAITDIPGVTLLVFSADCLPVFLLSGSWVGLAHAGWKGCRDKIVQKAVQHLLERSGEDPRSLKAVFGPCISVRHYEVGREFKTFFHTKEHDGKYYFDLSKECERQVIECGVPAKNIHKENICTYADNADFYSFRKEGEKAGRIVSFITKR